MPELPGPPSATGLNLESDQLDSMVAMALIRGWINDEQLAEADALCAKFKAEGLPLTLREALLKKGRLSETQVSELAKTLESARFADSIPGYKLLALLGQGAMGHVYRALDLNSNQTVAIKFLNPVIASQQGNEERFLREARISITLNHPNIVRGLALGEHNGLKYFAMEYIEGESVRDRLERDGTLSEADCTALALQITSALMAAEKVGLIHRDIKPDNIMITTAGDAKLCDLGLSRIANEDSSVTQSGIALGTPMYIAPEQAQALSNVSSLSDQYSLGASLYHAATGEPLFAEETPAATMTAHILLEAKHPQTLNPRLSNGFVAILRKMVAKEPNDRYLSLEALRTDLRTLRKGGEVSAFVFRAKSSVPGGYLRKDIPSDLQIDFGLDDPQAAAAAAAATRNAQGQGKPGRASRLAGRFWALLTSLLSGQFAKLTLALKALLAELTLVETLALFAGILALLLLSGFLAYHWLS